MSIDVEVERAVGWPRLWDFMQDHAWAQSALMASETWVSNYVSTPCLVCMPSVQGGRTLQETQSLIQLFVFSGYFILKLHFNTNCIPLQ